MLSSDLSPEPFFCLLLRQCKQRALQHLENLWADCMTLLYSDCDIERHAAMTAFDDHECPISRFAPVVSNFLLIKEHMLASPCFVHAKEPSPKPFRRSNLELREITVLIICNCGRGTASTSHTACVHEVTALKRMECCLSANACKEC